MIKTNDLLEQCLNESNCSEKESLLFIQILEFLKGSLGKDEGTSSLMDTVAKKLDIFIEGECDDL